MSIITLHNFSAGRESSDLTKYGKRWTRIWGRLLVLWLAFSFALIVNRGPIFFPDTTAYIRVADAAAVTLGMRSSEWSGRLSQVKVAGAEPDKSNGKRVTPLAGRSIYYGAILWLLGTWGAVLLQGFLASTAVLLTHRRLGSVLPFFVLPLTIALSSATVFAALLMPDLLAGLSLLALAMLLSGSQNMAPRERIFWYSLLLIGVLAHSATLLIVAAVIATAYFLWRKQLSYLPALSVLALGIAGEIGFSAGVYYTVGHPPLRPPFLSARLIDDGPGISYLKANCPSSGFALCSFYRELPDGSDAILWSGDGRGFISMPPERQRPWSEEDLRFVSSVFADRPFETSAVWMRATGRQFLGYSLDDVTAPLGSTEKLPPRIRGMYAATLVGSNSFPAIFWNALALPILISSALLLAYRRRDLPIQVKILLLGIAADIFICGALSTPHDRYLMRVAWLMPVMALWVIPTIRRRRMPQSHVVTVSTASELG